MHGLIVHSYHIPGSQARLKSGSFCLDCLQFWGLHANLLEQDLVSQEPGFVQDGK